MRRLIFILIAVFVSLSAHSKTLDSLVRQSLDNRLQEYLRSIEKEPVDVKIKESAYMISTCKEGEVRDYVAQQLYKHFLESKLMGDDAVSVYLNDNWFATGKANFSNSLDAMNAMIYADFNRSSLLGKRAPSLKLVDVRGDSVQVLGVAPDSSVYAGKADRLRVLYFYSTTCAKCKLESVMLADFLSKTRSELDVCLINTESDMGQWQNYINEKFSVSNSYVNISNYWDPELSSDFQMKYGVLETPRMFLISKDGIIIGRSLTTSALQELLSVRDKGLEDFKKKTEAYFNEIVGTRGPEARKTEEFMIDSLILSKPQIWSTADDSLGIVSFAQIRKDMLSRAPVGTRPASVKVTGTMLSAKCEKRGVYDLSKLKKETFILFYVPHCEFCEAEKKGISEILSVKKSDNKDLYRKILKLRFLLVDMDEMMSKDQETAFKLLDSFDLSLMPYMVHVDNQGIIKGRYISLAKGVESLLEVSKK